MSDQSNRTPLPEEPPECAEAIDLPALREVLSHQLRPRERDRVERLCASLLELTREAPVIVGRIASGGLDDQLRAAAADARHLERYLRLTGAAEGDALESWERRLADTALQLATPVGEVARQLEAAVVEVAP